MKNRGDKEKMQKSDERDESFVSPKLSISERLKAEQEFAEYRRLTESKKSDEEKLLSKILQFKFQIEDYAGSNNLEEHLNFGYFLRLYIKTIGKKNNEFAHEIDISPTELSQLINKHRDPSNKLIMRLEMHSNSIVHATSWYRIYSKDKTIELTTDERLRREEEKHVKRLELFM